MKRKDGYTFSAVCCYSAYFAFGMAYIMLAQNMSFLQAQFHTDAAGISFMIAAFGLGRLCTVFIDGMIVDKIGRKGMIMIGTIFMAAFLFGVPLAPSYFVALCFSAFGGLSIACLDTGTYPSLMEFFPKYGSSSTVILKAIISFGSALLPLLIIFLNKENLFYGLAFFLPGLIYITLFLLLIRAPFPRKESAVVSGKTPPHVRFKKKPKFWLDGAAFVLIGFTAPGLLYIMGTWLPTYGQQVTGMELGQSLKLVSYYNMGAILSVVCLALLLMKVLRPVTILAVFPVASFLSTVLFMITRSFAVADFAAFLIGVFTAGVFQLCIAVFCEFFWNRKGTVTGTIDTATGIAQAGIPFVTGLILRNTDIQGVFFFSLAVNGMGILLGLLVNYRYRRLLAGRDDELEPKSAEAVNR
ncbi:MFS transporter [Sporolactobacillus vineae]|uniref:MFS transporter n=1 Tax=Sporolactobacillus vineae TaxID=444463 RepID=UPI0002895B1F|nr:MFS transporter [Sporolactobacillus vineae]